MSDDLDMLAAEYVLGTLDPAERAGFERRLAGSEPARRAVEEWSRRLGPLAVAADKVEPPADMWDRIEERIASHGRVDNRVAPVVAANDNRVDEFQRSARGWRRAFIAAAALAASLAAFIAHSEWPGGNGLERASYVAIVGQKDGRPALIVNVDPASKSAFVIPVSAEAPTGRSLELWFIGGGEKPKPMGLLGAQPVRLMLPPGARVEKASLAVSVEPEGGSPTGSPTGPVIYSGQIVKS
jgi:anti-sigma-K factor RskA